MSVGLNAVGLPKPFTLWRHYKGGIYIITDVAYHSETKEAMVVYKNVETGDAWVRPARMWNDVIPEKEQKRRFELYSAR